MDAKKHARPVRRPRQTPVFSQGCPPGPENDPAPPDETVFHDPAGEPPDLAFAAAFADMGPDGMVAWAENELLAALRAKAEGRVNNPIDKRKAP